MAKTGQDGWLIKGSTWTEEEAFSKSLGKKQENTQQKTVMVYWMDQKTMRKEPIAILMERRKTNRGNDDVGMLRLARKTFARTPEEAQRIVIGDYE